MIKHASVRLAATLLALAVFGGGCTYSALRFRPVDTTSQLTVPGVRVLVGPYEGDGLERASTNEHGQADLSGLKSGDIVTFLKPGYEPTILHIGSGEYFQKSPAASKTPIRFELNDLDAIPVPLHRSGAVLPPTPMP